MRRVWKYTLPPDVAFRIEGGGARVVHVGIDPAADALMSFLPTVWVELEPEASGHIILGFVGTGHPVPWDGAWHVGSCMTPGGLVWHVYDIDDSTRRR
jgi:hypothetical protein